MLWILVIIIAVLLAVAFQLKWWSDKEFNKIPGPPGYFLFGNAFDFSWSSEVTFRRFRKLAAKYNKIYKLQLGPNKIAVIVNPEDAEILLTSSRNTRKGYLYKFLKSWLKDGLVMSFGEKWHQRRRILTPAFHFGMLQRYKPVLDDNSKRLVEKLDLAADSPKINIMTYIDECSLTAICETAMGIKLESNEFANKYRKSIHELGKLLYARGKKFWWHSETLYQTFSSIAQKEKQLLKLIDSFRNFVINKRRKESSVNYVPPETIKDDDESINNTFKSKRMAMLDILFQAEKEELIEKEGICEEVDTFIFEGHDTTATCLKYTLMLLANYPDKQNKVFDELNDIFGQSDRTATMQDLNDMKYLEYCIKESVRLYPPVYFIMRTLDEDVQLTNYKLSADVHCSISIYEIHRRADQFPEPQQFVPERFAAKPTWHQFAYLPFSAGIRNCIGQKFAMMEMKIMLCALLRRYKFLPITKPEELAFGMDVILRPEKPIYLKIERRARE